VRYKYIIHYNPAPTFWEPVKLRILMEMLVPKSCEALASTYSLLMVASNFGVLDRVGESGVKAEKKLKADESKL